MLIDQYFIDNAGKHRYICTLSNGVTIPLKFQEEATELQLQEEEEKYIFAHALDNIPVLIPDSMRDSPIINEFVQKVVENPTITSAQYNAWLSTKNWAEQAMVRNYLGVITEQLVLDNNTEGVALSRFREKIKTLSRQQIDRILLGQ